MYAIPSLKSWLLCIVAFAKNHIPGKDSVFLVVLGNSSEDNFDMAV
jgi:hypothetical protein